MSAPATDAGILAPACATTHAGTSSPIATCATYCGFVLEPATLSVRTPTTRLIPPSTIHLRTSHLDTRRRLVPSTQLALHRHIERQSRPLRVRPRRQLDVVPRAGLRAVAAPGAQVGPDEHLAPRIPPDRSGRTVDHACGVPAVLAR